MSSADEEYNDGDNASGSLQGSKKRRIQRACDICRRKKIRCDGGQMPGNRCSNCIAYNYECTYVEAAKSQFVHKKRGPPKGYVESLENRLEKMEKLLSKLCPDADFSQELGGQLDQESWSMDRSGSTMANPSTNAGGQLHATTLRPVNAPDLNTGDEGLSDDEFHQQTLTDSLKKLAVNPVHHRFFGKSSGVVLIQKAMHLKNEYTGSPTTSISDDTDLPKRFLPSKREEFWDIHPWELKTMSAPKDYRLTYVFPDADLLPQLVDFYFSNVNVFTPILHRPTFEKGIADGMHLEDDGFGTIVMLVCAIGARFSDDPRVFLENTSTHSCGWKWFEQVRMVRKSLLAPPRLYDLQMHCLSVLFLQYTSAPQACWTMVGIGVRLAQDVGAHRRKVYNHNLTVEDELWKRAFWVLVCLDRYISSNLGRPCAIQDEDFDLDLPVECDDEYWVTPDPEKAFKQPPGIPSTTAFFICYLRLNQILAFALRTIYSINKSKILLGFVGQEWEQHIVAELDSALNKWIDSVPDHLRWDPTRENMLFFNQSATLHACYYHLQILIHRPFIPSPRKPSPLTFPSLAICTNAARTCSHIVDSHRRRSDLPLPYTQMAIFTSGVVLLLNIWGGKRSGLSMDPAKEMADVHKCMKALRAHESRWHSMGRLWDILYELASVGDLPLPQPSPAANMKRERDSDSPISSTPPMTSNSTPSSASTPSFAFMDAPRSIIGSRRVKDMATQQQQPHPQPPQQHQQQHLHPQSNTFTLPMYSNELGRLPLHGQVSFDPRPPSGGGDTNDNLWYPLSTMSGDAGLGNSGVGDMNTAFPMDQLFYDQMASNFSAASFPQTPSGAQYQGTGGTQAIPSMSGGPMPNALDSDTIAMWSTAPTGFELDDWGTYISGMMHGQPSSSG